MKGEVTFQTYKPPSINHPTHGGSVEFVITATLDLRATLPLDGASDAKATVNVELRNRRDFSFALPALEPGHHCLVVAALESPAVLSKKGMALPHYAASAFDVSAGQGPDHCQAAQAGSGVVANRPVVTCDSAVISPNPDRTFRGGRFHAGTPLWTHVPPPCPNMTAMSLVYFNGEHPLLDAGRFGPVAMPLDANRRRIALGALPKGSWWVLLVMSGAHSSAHFSPPVFIT